MRRTVFAGTIFCLALLGNLPAQEVEIMREAAVIKETAVSSDEYVEAESGADENVTPPIEKRTPAAESSVVTKPRPGSAIPTISAKPATTVAATKTPVTPVTKPAVAQKAPATKLSIDEMRRGGEIAAERLKKETTETVAAAPAKPTAPLLKPMERTVREPEPRPQFANFSGQTAFIRLADGFDFPVGKPDAKGYYRARGFRANGHLGEDWDGVGGGDTDLGDPIYCIGDGVVVFARDCHMGWGNVIIVRHAYREGGMTHNVDSLYGHLQKIMVRPGQKVKRGEQIATLGNAHGLYDAHLHLEVRKNIEIGMSRTKFAQDYSNYFDPSQFILTHRHLQGGSNYRVAMNTFAHDARIPWDKLKNYSHPHTGGGTGESSVALKKALAAQSGQ